MSLTNDFIWQGRVDEEDGELGKRWHQQVTSTPVAEAKAVLLGFGCDLGVANNKGRIGARKGPDTIRAALASYAWHAPIALSDAGTVQAQSDLADAQTEFASAVAEHLSCKRFVMGIGGGNEIAWASYQGLREATNGKIGIINIDAHFDLRTPSPHTSSGTPFYQIYQDAKCHQTRFNYACIGVAETANTQALFERAKQTNTHYVLDKDCTFDTITAAIQPMLDRIDTLYFTVCLDAFNAAVAPGVSAPATLGISFEVVLKLIAWLGQQTKLQGIEWPMADIAEMNPDYDIDQRTAKCAARLIHEIVSARFS